MDTRNLSGIAVSATLFECSICYETHSDNLISVKGDAVCKDCFQLGIKPQFLAALKDESQYPVRWGNAELNIFDFATFFDTEFLSAFLAKQREYAVLPNERLHCAGTAVASDGSAGEAGACGHFLGIKSARPAGRRCDECDSRTCSCCGSLVGGLLKDHKCQAAGDDAEAFAELKRGVDYQKCPGCGGVVQLRDGCNHLICSVPACRSNFCYICGEHASAGSGHWDAGKPCPKYNQPGSANAMFEAPAMFDDLPGVDAFDDLPGVDAFDDLPGVGMVAPLGFGGLLAPVDPPTPFMDPARREAIGILHDRSIDDLRHDSIQEHDPPELRLRKIDRRELNRIVGETQDIDLAATFLRGSPDFVPPPEYIGAVHTFATMLSSLVEVYTIHLETNEAARELVAETMETLQRIIEIILEEIGDAGFERFPTLRRIVDTYQLAVRGEIEELRRQTRD